MKIILDDREQQLYHLVNEKNDSLDLKLTIEKKTLPLGDIVFVDDNEKEIVIVERKSLSDLVASIKDGRYEEQSYRLNGLDHPNHNIIYLVEGNLTTRNSSFKKIDNRTIYSAMFSLLFYKGFSVVRTFDLEETATFLLQSLVKLTKERNKKSPYYKTSNTCQIESVTPETSPTVEKDYVTVIKKVKKENITSDNIGEIMLCQIPDVSSVSSLAIMQKFKTLSKLIKDLESDPKCLNDITTISKTGQKRKISSKVIENIKIFLL